MPQDQSDVTRMLTKATLLYKQGKIGKSDLPDRVMEDVKKMDNEYSEQQLRRHLQGSTKQASSDTEVISSPAARKNKDGKNVLVGLPNGKQIVLHQKEYKTLNRKYPDMFNKEKQAQLAGASKLLDKAMALGRLGRQKGSKYVSEYSDALSGKKLQRAKDKLRKDRKMLGSDAEVANQGGIAKSRQALKDEVSKQRRRKWQAQGSLIGAPFAAGIGTGFALDGEEKKAQLASAGKMLDNALVFAKNKGKKLLDLGKSKADEASEGIANFVEQSKGNFPAMARLQRQKGKRWLKDNPGKAVGAAGATGLTGGYMFGKEGKAKSKSQQRLMGMAYAYKKGELDTEDISKEMLGKIKDIADDMTLEELKEYAETKRKNLPEEKKEASLDKAEKVFHKMAQKFQGYVSSKDGIEDAKMKKLKSKGYKRVSGEEYAESRGNAVIEGFKNKAKKYDEKVDTQKKGLTAGTGLLGGAIPLAATLDAKIPKKIKAGLVAGGTLLGGAGGYALGRSKEKEYQGKKKKVLKSLKEKADAMKDVYSIEDTGNRSFWMKPQDN